MLNIAQNKILCDKCQKEINKSNTQIEAKHLANGIRIQFFRCASCKTKYLIDVTDKETREKQIEYARLGNYQKQLMISITSKNFEEIEPKTIENNKAMEKLLAEIKESKSILKEKYKDML